MSVIQTITTVLPSKKIKAFTLSDQETNKTISAAFTALVTQYKTNKLIISKNTVFEDTIIRTFAEELVISGDELTRTNTRTFTDQEAFDAFMAEPDVIAFFEARDNYNSANGITSTTVIT